MSFDVYRCGAGPAYSSSVVTDILSVPCNMDTSLSAPPGDPTFTLTPKHPSSKSRLNPSKTLDKPPLAPKPLVTDEPLTALGLGSPNAANHTHAGLTKDQASKSGRPGAHNHASTSSAGLPLKDAASSTQVRVKPGDANSGGPHAVPTARSHLTEDLAAAMQQEEERRASHSQAESSSSSPARRNGFLSKLVGGSGKGKGSSQEQKLPTTPFELASQQFLGEQGPASPDQEPVTNGNTHHSPTSTTAMQSWPQSLAKGSFASAHNLQPKSGVENGERGRAGVQRQKQQLAGPDQQRQHSQRDQQDQQKDDHIGGSPSEAAHRLIDSLQALG